MRQLADPQMEADAVALRRETGRRLRECRLALVRNDGNVEAALKELAKGPVRKDLPPGSYDYANEVARHLAAQARRFGRLRNEDIRNEAQKHALGMLGVLVDVAYNGQREAARIAAAEAVLDRGLGKVAQTIRAEGKFTLETVLKEIESVRVVDVSADGVGATVGMLAATQPAASLPSSEAAAVASPLKALPEVPLKLTEE